MILALNALWNKQADCSISNLLEQVKECGCSVIETRSIRLADQQGFMALFEGHWNQIARLEASLEHVGQQDNVHLSTVRCNAEQPTSTRIPYTIDVYGADHKDLLSEICSFFQLHGIEIEDMSSSRFHLMDSAGPVFNAHFLVLIPSDQSLLGLRDDFLSFCDELKVDALMEPSKR